MKCEQCDWALLSSMQDKHWISHSFILNSLFWWVFIIVTFDAVENELPLILGGNLVCLCCIIQILTQDIVDLCCSSRIYCRDNRWYVYQFNIGQSVSCRFIFF